MQNRQYILRRTISAVVALTCLVTVSLTATPATAGRPSNTLTPTGATQLPAQKSLSTNNSWLSAPEWSTVVTGTVEKDGPIRVQVVCTVSIGAPFRLGNGNVTLDWSVICDGQVRMIQGLVGIFQTNGVPLGNTVDQFTIFGLGGGNNITRPCASGLLQGVMRVRVTFLSGSPLVIDGIFGGPPASVSC